ncbi:MAG: hypothetical protein ACN6O7_00275 [Sphingobacterium sp.]
MRKIPSTEILKNKFANYQKTLFDSRNFQKPKDALKDILKVKNTIKKYGLNKNKVNAYINKIINEYDDILIADPNRIEELISEFEQLIPANNITQKFSEDIVDALRYNALREKEFIMIIQELGIKTCVYCHAQLTVVIDKDRYERNYKDLGVKKGDIRTRRGFLELDHRHAKSKYPFLATSFYNLYPVCGNCNRAKSDKKSPFDLYTNSEELDILKFSIKDSSTVLSLVNNDYNQIEIEITTQNLSKADSDLYMQTFDIQGIYDTQKDLIHELLYKKVVYTDKYKNELIEEFKDLFPDKSIIDRLIIGNYDKPEDVHKRPMAKFVQDIARDIELIPPLPAKNGH